jgi:hypothetical protein
VQLGDKVDPPPLNSDRKYLQNDEVVDYAFGRSDLF